jgi:hypothetical protein
MMKINHRHPLSTFIVKCIHVFLAYWEPMEILHLIFIPPVSMQEEDISGCTRNKPLKIVGCVERIVPGLTNRQFQMHFRVNRHFIAARYLTDVKSDVGNMGTLLVSL